MYTDTYYKVIKVVLSHIRISKVERTICGKDNVKNSVRGETFTNL